MNQPLGRDTLDAARAMLASARSTRRDFMAIVVIGFRPARVQKRVLLLFATFQLLYQPHEGLDRLLVSFLTENWTISALRPSE